MTSTLGRLLAAGALLAGVSGLSGCGLFNGGSRAEEALEFLPADSTSVTFVDRVAIAERVGIEDLKTGASEDDIGEWADATIDEGYGTALTQYVSSMQEAAFSDFDVEWEASGVSEGQGLTVWKLNDDVDFDDIASDLEDAGFKRSGNGDRPEFVADIAATEDNGLIGGHYPPAMTNTALVPDEHLVITGDIKLGLAVATDKKDSLSDKGSYDDLLDAAPSQDGLEYAVMILEPTCEPRAVGQEQQAQEADQDGTLGQPAKGIAFYANPDERLTIVRMHADDDAAKAEAEGFDDYLEESGFQSGLDVDFDVEQDGSKVLVEADFDDRNQVSAALNQLAGPFACASSS